ncbi:hypothetical protein ACLKA7_012128 [Drosophila subpalustris]
MSLTKESTEASGAAQAQSQSKEETQQEPSALTINTNANTNAHGALNQHQLMLAMLEEKRATEERYIEQKYKLLAQMNGQEFTLPISAPPPVAGIGGPSSSQLAARHAIPKELPKFSGDPEDWPCFISTFEHSTSVAGLSDVENMLRLQKCLGGKARELVKDKLLIPSMVSDVISTLKMFFGRPEHILERMIDRVRKLPPPKDRLESFIDFALAVRNICAMMEASNLTAHLNNPMLVKELVEKLPNKHKLDWAMHPKSCQPPVKEFSDWIYKIAEAASTVICPSTYKANPVNSHYEDPNQASSSNQKVAASTPTPTPKQNTSKCMACGSQEHSAPQCESFNKMSVDERWTKAKSARACYRCLKNHRKGCFMKKTCGINGCSYKHHPLLHKDDPSKSSIPQDDSPDQVVVGAHSNANKNHYFRIVPVNIHLCNKTTLVYAFLDEGSSVTLMDEETFNTLGIKGVPSPICLQWTSEATRNESSSIRASIRVSGVSSERCYQLNNVHTIRNLALPWQSLNADKLCTKYPYLKGVPLQSYPNIRPVLLIGADNWKIAVPRKLLEGKYDQPIASKCLLGWSIQGTSKTTTNWTMHHCDCQWQQLHDMVKESFSLETVKPRSLLSEDDKMAVKILDKTCTKVNGRFEIGLLWRNINNVLPESYQAALNRLNCLKRKIQREPGLYNKIEDQVNNLVQKGYAVELTETEIDNPPRLTWYLPIFITLNPNKPNKVRLVWDAAAKSHGAALNDFILTGPDLLTPLLEILLAFRVGQVAVCGDIAEMFHRITIRKEDRQAQRFLWYDQSSGKVKAYVMHAMTFGISCAPCIAHYVRNKNVEPYRQLQPRLYEAIQKAHYVDDYIDSMDTEQEALEMSKLVRKVHSEGGFQIRNWSSNSAKVLGELLKDGKPAEQLPVQFGDTEKILGMYWEPRTDCFRYVLRFARLRRDVLSDDIVPTKRELLQVLMSVFDPLGLVSCFTIGLKILLQHVWRSKVGWDEELPQELSNDWENWKRLLPQIQMLEIPRCYSQNLTKAKQAELHIFVDASEYAYAAVCYARVQLHDVVHVALVAAKCKVAPLKPLSIPRMELQAAVAGLRLGQKITTIRGLKVNNITYWSDSKTVLQWLKMDPRKFQQFVMHRIGEILESSDVKQWRWIPTKINVADKATKVSSAVDIANWLHGPDFLQSTDAEWPMDEIIIDETDTAELRKHVHVTSTKPSININVEYFSQWRRLYRAVATFLLYVDRLKPQQKTQMKPDKVNLELINRAQNLLFKQAQAHGYFNEISKLSAKLPLPKQSNLRGLNVYIDANGILRTQGRSSDMNCRDDAIVLPRQDYITFLIVKAFHEDHHHQAHETVINNVKSVYCIPKLRVLYKSVRQRCQKCKNDAAIPAPPQMAPVPVARMASFKRPFTFTGIDYFGPIFVNVGRHKEKRWGVIFTCMTLRAVHFEIAYSLDTSSCIMCLRNFMARRGTPAEIFSDNGTNLRSTEKALKEELVKIDFDDIMVKYDRIKWRFNPPGAPHMGGAWERLIRTTKGVLKAISPNYAFNDETLRCALMEAEFIINSRPLTFVSLESSDDVALTPNHLLLGTVDGYKPICSDELDLRQRWHQSQTFGDQFWKRWVKEYAPVLTRRSKWFEKTTPIQIGSVVVVVDENLPRNMWPMGRIINTITAKDGQVRRVTIKTNKGTMERPATKVAVLDVGKP